jgi:hypothetical protein
MGQQHGLDRLEKGVCPVAGNPFAGIGNALKVRLSAGVGLGFRHFSGQVRVPFGKGDQAVGRDPGRLIKIALLRRGGCLLMGLDLL